jgi:D-sedoheptulose 7-phosphate isomerase
MDLHNRINEHFKQNVLLTSQLAPLLAEPIEQASALIAESLLARKKILACGNSVCAANAQYLVSRLMGHLDFERPGLAAINLSQDIQLITAMAQTNDLAQLYSRQISALGEEGDVLFAMCMSGESDNVTQAILRARENGLQVIAMVGGDGGEMMQTLQDTDILISVASHEIARVQEIFILVIHCICDAVDSILLGVE